MDLAGVRDGWAAGGGGPAMAQRPSPVQVRGNSQPPRGGDAVPELSGASLNTRKRNEPISRPWSCLLPGREVKGCVDEGW